MKKPVLAALAAALYCANWSPASAQLYIQAPLGAGGTYNLYEVRGLGDVALGNRFGRYEVLNGSFSASTGAGDTWQNAFNAAASTTESISGTNQTAHLVAINSAEENGLVHEIAQWGDVWIGLTDDPNTGLAGAAETGTGDPIADGQRGLNNVDPGWRWQGGSTFNYTNWSAGEPNNAGTGEHAVHLGGNSAWNDNAQAGPAFKYVYEYETQSATPLDSPNILNLSAPQSAPGPGGGNGYMTVREVINNGEPISGVLGALNSLFVQQEGAISHTYQAPVLNMRNAAGGPAEGRIGGDSEFGVVRAGLAPADVDLNNVAVSAKGTFRVGEGQGGDYTFQVNSDDGAEIWIHNKRFTSNTNGSISSYGSVIFPGDRGPADTLGVINLEPGDYEFEVVYNENGGGANVEFSAAQGVHTAHNLTNFRLVGAPEQTVSGMTPKVTSPWNIREVIRLPEGTGNVETLAQARELLNNPPSAESLFTGTSDAINFADPDTNGGGASGRFGGDTNFLNDAGFGADDNDFALHATATLEITTAGDYTFGFAGDDGGELTIIGASFRTISSQVGASITNSGQSLTADIPTGDSLTFGTTTLEPGQYQIEYTFFERAGGAWTELYVAPGEVNVWDTNAFRLLSTTSEQVDATIGGGLQLVGGAPNVPGDTNADGVVDLTDLNNVRNNFGGSGLGDTNGDGSIDLEDLNAVRNNFGATASPSAVPEPASFALAALTGIGALLFGKRRRR
jgi:hypothetical protein